MSDEEKKAIEEFKKLKDYKHTYYGYTWFKVEVCADDEMKQNIDIILNLIVKQQKEIEELKEKNKQKYYHVVKSRKLEREINNAWENKIRAEIEELQNMKIDGEVFKTSVNFAIKVLQSLLEKEDKND